MVEENAIYYAAGYTVQKLIRKYSQMDDSLITDPKSLICYCPK